MRYSQHTTLFLAGRNVPAITNSTPLVNSSHMTEGSCVSLRHGPKKVFSNLIHRCHVRYKKSQGGAANIVCISLVVYCQTKPKDKESLEPIRPSQIT